MPGHVTQLPHRRQPVSQSRAASLSACGDGAKQHQRFHEMLSSVINHGSFRNASVHICDKHTASRASRKRHRLRVSVCVSVHLPSFSFLLVDHNAVAGQLCSAINLNLWQQLATRFDEDECQPWSFWYLLQKNKTKESRDTMRFSQPLPPAVTKMCEVQPAH